MTIGELLMALLALIIVFAIPLLVIIGLVWAVVRRVEQKTKEGFERREN